MKQYFISYSPIRWNKFSAPQNTQGPLKKNPDRILFTDKWEFKISLP